MPAKCFIDSNVIIYALGSASTKAPIAAALEAGCDTLYSEDMQDGQKINGKLRIVNPF